MKYPNKDEVVVIYSNGEKRRLRDCIRDNTKLMRREGIDENGKVVWWITANSIEQHRKGDVSLEPFGYWQDA